MNTKLTAFLTAVIFTLTPALSFGADYYPDVEFPQFESSDFIACPIDINKYNEAENKVRSVASDNGDGLIEALNYLDSIVNSFQTSYVLYYISASQNNTEENNEKLSEARFVISQVSERISNLVFELYEMPSARKLVTEWFGGEEAMNEFLASRPGERFYEINEKENQLLTQYRNSSFELYEYTADDGNTYTLDKLEEKIYSLLEMLNSEMNNDEFDYSTVYNEYQRISGYILDYFEQSGVILAEIFSSLVKVRTEIAEEEGYDNYADYAHAVFYGRDYTAEDIAVLRESTKKYIVPLYLALENIIANENATEIEYDDIVPTIQRYIGRISPELEESFLYLTKSGLLDMDISKSKVTPGTAYTIDIPEYGVPFVFISPVENNTSWTLETLVHEFGHFNANLYGSLTSSYNSVVYEASDIDLCEIHSQGLELLFAQFYDEIYSDSSDITYLACLRSMLGSIIDGCLYDEWQEKVYKNPNMSIEEMNELFITISQNYGKEDVYDYIWVQVPHNFEEPMYYIGYAVSAVAALDLWVLSVDDCEGAVDRYMRTTAYSDDTPFKKTLSALGYNDIFCEDTIISITEEISGFASLGYKDITVDDWYWQAVVETNSFLDDSVNNGNFRPEDNILRCEMINSIGKLNEYLGNSIDVTESADNSKYIAWAASVGIVKGYDEYTVGEYDNLTREQAAVLLYRFFGENYSPNTSSLDGFSDYEQVSDWAYNAVLWAVDEGIIRGTDMGEYVLLNPQSSVTRAQAAQIMSRFMYYIYAINL